MTCIYQIYSYKMFFVFGSNDLNGDDRDLKERERKKKKNERNLYARQKCVYPTEKTDEEKQKTAKRHNGWHDTYELRIF